MTNATGLAEQPVASREAIATPQPVPVLLAEAIPGARRPGGSPMADAGALPTAPEGREITRVATVAGNSDVHPEPGPELGSGDSTAPARSATLADFDDPIVRAKRIIAESRSRYLSGVSDYSCIFFKRERIGGRMTPQYVMLMKFRVRPKSVYLKFLRPDSRAGREAIYVAGRHAGKALVHDIGLGKFLAGTLALDPRSTRAMEDCRHPITEAGLGHLLDTLAERWAIEMKHGETEVAIHPNARVGDRTCTLIISTHPERQPDFMFHSVKVYVDSELNLPIRFEAYDWPRAPGHPPELVEEYTYTRLKLNVGLSERDFDPSNAEYSFGRF